VGKKGPGGKGSRTTQPPPAISSARCPAGALPVDRCGLATCIHHGSEPDFFLRSVTLPPPRGVPPGAFGSGRIYLKKGLNSNQVIRWSPPTTSPMSDSRPPEPCSSPHGRTRYASGLIGVSLGPNFCCFRTPPPALGVDPLQMSIFVSTSGLEGPFFLPPPPHHPVVVRRT